MRAHAPDERSNELQRRRLPITLLCGGFIVVAWLGGVVNCAAAASGQLEPVLPPAN
jgi:hypothetical protein